MSKLKPTLQAGLDFWRMTQGKIVEGVFGMRFTSTLSNPAQLMLYSREQAQGHHVGRRNPRSSAPDEQV